jgi:S1-C subfamily serine protease
MSSTVPVPAFDSERAAVARAAGEFVISLSDGRTSLSAIAWRADLAVAPAERLSIGDQLSVRGAGSDATAEVLALDLATDVGILRAARVWNREARPATSDPESGVIAALVAREGSDLAIEWRTIRKVGAAWRSRRGARIERRIEIDSGLALPAEGSAILAPDGGVIGMAVHGTRRRVLGIPFETIERVVAEVALHGRVRRAFLGVSLLPLPLAREVSARWRTDANTALVVADVSPGSPAATAGLDVGDLVLAADGAPVQSVGALSSLIRERGPGAVLRLVRRRGTAVDELEVSLGERPAR